MTSQKNIETGGSPDDGEAAKQSLPTVEERYGPRTEPRQFRPETVQKLLFKLSDFESEHN